MRIKLEYIEVQILLTALDGVHLPVKSHSAIKKSLVRRLERMETDYTGGWADNPINAKIDQAVSKHDKIKKWTEIPA
tara:strand:+ start:294 stop:524 length:231 start_codon:yes stop_codon:yes gene_type:complete